MSGKIKTVALALRLVFALVVVIVGNVICSALIINRDLFFYGFLYSLVVQRIWKRVCYVS